MYISFFFFFNASNNSCLIQVFICILRQVLKQMFLCYWVVMLEYATVMCILCEIRIVSMELLQYEGDHYSNADATHYATIRVEN